MRTPDDIARDYAEKEQQLRRTWAELEQTKAALLAEHERAERLAADVEYERLIADINARDATRWRAVRERFRRPRKAKFDSDPRPRLIGWVAVIQGSSADEAADRIRAEQEGAP